MHSHFKRGLLTFATVIVFCVGATAADRHGPDADNTKRNAEDRSGRSKTPGDQSNTQADLTITQAIRKGIIRDAALTLTAKNVKIIATNGHVTLRGPVNSPEEKAKIESLAKAAAGEGKVDNQLEVKASK